MFKLIAFLTRKPGKTLAQFRDHYENSPLPMARRTFPQILEHRRNYIDQGGVMFPADGPAPQWDCLAEIWFESRAGFDSMVATVMDPKAGAELREDEVKFLDSAKTGMLMVEEVKATGL